MRRGEIVTLENFRSPSLVGCLHLPSFGEWMPPVSQDGTHSLSTLREPGCGPHASSTLRLEPPVTRSDLRCPPSYTWPFPQMTRQKVWLGLNSGRAAQLLHAHAADTTDGFSGSHLMNEPALSSGRLDGRLYFALSH